MRFLYGDPHGVGAMDPRSGQPRSFRLNDDGGIQLRQVLAQRALARACAATAPEDKDGRPNPKALVFTTFADTARHLYDGIAEWARNELGVHAALVTGGDGNRCTTGPADLAGILARFAPRNGLPNPRKYGDCGVDSDLDIHLGIDKNERDQ